MPLVYMKVNSLRAISGSKGGNVKSSNNNSNMVYKGFRSSFVRATFYVASARQETQLQCLMWCFKSGSARKAAKALMENMLQPTLTVLDVANS